MTSLEGSNSEVPLKIFLHIPKTAGVAVREILTSRLQEDEVLHITDPESVGPNFSISEKIRFLHGHIDISVANFFSKNRNIYTFLRDPLRRAISEYHFVRNASFRASDLPEKQRNSIKEVQLMTLSEYLVCDKWDVGGRVQNAQLFYLSGDVFNASLSLEERYERACEVLDECHFVGIVEQMRKSIELLNIIECLPPSTPVKRNATAVPDDPIEDNVLSVFEERNSYDYKLYDYAKHKMNDAYECALRNVIRDRYLDKLSLRPAMERLDYYFDMPLEGDGWHTRENDGKVYWRFTGPGNVATLYFPPFSEQVKTVAFQVHYAVTPKHFEEFSVKLNGSLLNEASRIGNEVVFTVPPSALRCPYTCIEITTLPTVMPSEGDDRKLGVAFSAIKIE